MGGGESKWGARAKERPARAATHVVQLPTCRGPCAIVTKYPSSRFGVGTPKSSLEFMGSAEEKMSTTGLSVGAKLEQLVSARLIMTYGSGTPISAANCERTALPKTIAAVALGSEALYTPS